MHIIIFTALLWFSVLKRMRVRKIRMAGYQNLPTDPLESPVSRAISEMLGVAGGIYLALLVLVSFLQINIPSTVNIFGVKMEPLAFISVIITLLQPYAVELKQYWGG